MESLKEISSVARLAAVPYANHDDGFVVNSVAQHVGASTERDEELTPSCVVIHTAADSGLFFQPSATALNDTDGLPRGPRVFVDEVALTRDYLCNLTELSRNNNDSFGILS